MDPKLLAAIKTNFEAANDRPMTTGEASFVECLIPALFAALPVFLQSFMGCLGGTPGTGYNPGQRDRC